MAHGIQITFDAADPASLASFWAVALGYVEQPPPDEYDSWEDFAQDAGIPEERWGDLAAVIDPAGIGPRILFQRVPEGKTAKNRVHLDVNAASGTEDGETRRAAVEAHATRLEEAGARRVDTFDRGHEFWIVMTDPEGNEFCVQ